MLTNDQKEALEQAKKYSCLITGSAGTGKSYLVNDLIEYFEDSGKNIAVTATTGVAAVNIGGSTIFSWAGIGLGDKDIATTLKEVRRNKKARDRIIYTEVLIIDEISMLRGDVLDKLDYVFRNLRGNAKAFGGLQIIYVGDMLQLPNIPYKGVYDFVFNSKAWRHQNPKILELKEIVRQEDKKFAELLNNVRIGNVANLDLLKDRFGAKLQCKKIKPVHIFCKNVDVDFLNQSELKKISSPSFFFKSKDEGDSRYLENLDRNCPAPRNLELKVGAQVILLKNVDVENGLCNGSIGIVKKINHLPTVEFDGRDVLVEKDEWQITEQEVNSKGKLKTNVKASRVQVPLKLCYATTVHKSQGQTLDKVYLDLSQAWEFGAHYVGLSRVRSLEDLSLEPFDINKIKAHPECLSFYGYPTR